MQDKVKHSNIWQERFESFEAEPATDLWTGIEPKLPRGRRIMPLFLYGGIAASVLILIAFIVLLTKPTPEMNSPEIAKTEQLEVEPVAPQLVEVPQADLRESEQLAEFHETTETVEKAVMANKTVNKKSSLATISNAESQAVVETMVENDPPQADILKDNPKVEKKATLFAMEVPQASLALNETIPDAPFVTVASPAVVEKGRQAKPKKNKLDLENLAFDDVLAFASNGLNKIVNTPLEVGKEKLEDGEVRTIEFSFANFKFTKKKYKQKIKKSRS